MSDIFVSYKREDKPAAERVKTALERQGWSVWWDPNLHAGEHFDDVIEAALQNAGCVIVLWSETSVNSRYVRDEATYALNREKLIPVEIEPADPPFRFERLHTVKLHNWDGSEDSPRYLELIGDIREKIGPPSHEITEEGTLAGADEGGGSKQGYNGSRESRPILSKWLLLGSVVLGAVFSYSAWGILVGPLGEWGINHHPYLEFLAFLIVSGGGLWWMKHRYRTPSVQVGALGGAGIVIGLSTVLVLTDRRFGIIHAILAVPAVFAPPLITSVPTSEAGRFAGVTLLWRIIRRWIPL